jgi:large subunit ribosomal protein L15
VEYNVINLDTLEGIEGDVVSPETLRAAGLVHKHGLVKVLGRGELTRRLQVSAHAFSRSATAAIEAAGGRIEVLPPPFGHGRPPARGNALTNR